MTAILRDAKVNNKELQTVFVSLESLMNSVSDDPNDDTVLTQPFLDQSNGRRTGPRKCYQTSFNPRKRWRQVQELVRRVW